MFFKVFNLCQCLTIASLLLIAAVWIGGFFVNVFFFFSSSAFPAVSLGLILGEIFAYVTFFSSSHRGSHILSLWMVHAGYVYVAGIQPSRTRMSMCWNACILRLDLSLYSHPKEFLGNGVRTHINSKGKIPSTGRSEDWTHDATSHRTPSQWTTYWAILAPVLFLIFQSHC